MNQTDHKDRLAAIAYAIAERVPIGATVVDNGDGTTNISFPLPTEQTLELYREAVLLHPDNAELRQDFSFALRRTGHLEDAVAQLHEAVRLDPNDVCVHLSLARCYEEAHDFPRACQKAKEAVRLSTEDRKASPKTEVSARYLLGELLHKTGEIIAAREELSKAFELANIHQDTRLITHIQSALEALGDVSL